MIPILSPLPMVDLKGQYNRLKDEIDDAIAKTVASTRYIGGPEVQNFATNLEEYLGVKHVIPCANGTDALQIALMALKLQPGDEVIVPAFTFVATAEVIALLRLTPVMVDVDPHTFNIDLQGLEKAISPKTKAIVPVHLFGQCAAMEEIMAIAEKNDLLVIEDAAQSIGATYTFSNGSSKASGTIGHIGTTSFFPSKNLGCYGDGGAIFTNGRSACRNDQNGCQSWAKQTILPCYYWCKLQIRRHSGRHSECKAQVPESIYSCSSGGCKIL